MLIDGMPKSTDIVDTVAAFGYFLGISFPEHAGSIGNENL